jgi:hypothetical protein
VVVFVVVFFGIFLIHERTNVHDPAAHVVALSRREIRKRLQSIPLSRILLTTQAAYRWRPFDPTSPNDRCVAQVIVTDKALILRPSFVTVASGGLLLPSYWIPLASVREAVPAQKDGPGFLYRPFALKGGRLVAITLLSGATCTIRFRSDAEWQVLVSALEPNRTDQRRD